MTVETETSLGPATVVDVEDGRVLLQGRGWADLALAVPYHPEPGDVVLAIGEDRPYVIGVLRGRGRTVLRAAGDLEIRAEGRIAIAGPDGVDIEGRQVTVRADRFEILAHTAVEKLIRCYRWVKEAIQTRAGRTRTLVDGEAVVRAERIVQSARREVKIDGDKIHLG